MDGEPKKPEVLQFDTAEPKAPTAAACANCHGPLSSTYFELNAHGVCAGCHLKLQAFLNRGAGGFAVFAKAAGLGLLAAVAGSLGWYAIRAISGWELGIVAIGVGILVGLAVRRGSGNRGGWAYQALAMFLTYNAAAMNYAPDVIRMFRQAAEKRHAAEAARKPAPAAAQPKPEAPPPTLLQVAFAFAVLYGFILAVPFLAGLQNILGIIIIGIGVYEAWKINRRPKLILTGPYQLAERPVGVAGG